MTNFTLNELPAETTTSHENSLNGRRCVDLESLPGLSSSHLVSNPSKGNASSNIPEETSEEDDLTGLKYDKDGIPIDDENSRPDRDDDPPRKVGYRAMSLVYSWLDEFDPINTLGCARWTIIEKVYKALCKYQIIRPELLRIVISYAEESLMGHMIDRYNKLERRHPETDIIREKDIIPEEDTDH